MNWVFWFLIVIILIVVWFCIAGIFKTVGNFILTIFNDTKNIMMEKKEKKEK